MSTHKIYILLTDTGTLFTRMIKYYTKNPYNHASLSFDPQIVQVYSFGRKTARNPFIGGFVKENFRMSMFRKAKCAIYSATVTSQQLEEMISFIQSMEKEKNKYRYNLLGVLAIMLNKEINRENSFFCSQFVATVLQKCGVVDFKKPLSQVTPYDLVADTHFDLVYEGSLDMFYREIGLERKLDLAYTGS